LSDFIPTVPWPALSRNLVAILRGITPAEAKAIGQALVDAGFEAIEVPLNSPDPLASIECLIKTLPPHILVGAGTVLTVAQAEAVAKVGGRLMVSPNIDEQVVRTAGRLGMVTMPGVFTPTEAFAALRSGASALKFFPASTLGTGGIAAMKAVLPRDAWLGAVGGVAEGDFAAYAKVGVTIFGLGSSLYQPSMTADDVALLARGAVAAYDRVFGKEVMP
jgi:2-dehydro-3-deoxyphosphogalactonate aldolase